MTDSAVKVFVGDNAVLATDYDAATNRHTLKTTGGGSGSASNISGATAAGAALTANPVTGGGRAATALPTAVADGQVVNGLYDKYGRAVSVGAIRENKFASTGTATASTTETDLIAAEASTFHDVYGLILANTGASGTEVSIRDDAAGTVRMTFYVPAGETRGFMLPAGDGYPQTAVNKKWTFQCATSTSSMKVTAFYIKNT